MPFLFEAVRMVERGDAKPEVTMIVDLKGSFAYKALFNYKGPLAIKQGGTISFHNDDALVSNVPGR